MSVTYSNAEREETFLSSALSCCVSMYGYCDRWLSKGGVALFAFGQRLLRRPCSGSDLGCDKTL